MDRFSLLYLCTSFVCLTSIELLKMQWPKAPEDTEPPQLSLIAIPPKPEGAMDKTSGEGSAIQYSEEKCNNTKHELIKTNGSIVSSIFAWTNHSSSDCHIPTNVGGGKDAEDTKQTEVAECGPGDEHMM